MTDSVPSLRLHTDVPCLWTILLAAGSGERFRAATGSKKEATNSEAPELNASGVDKLLVSLAGRPVLLHALARLQQLAPHEGVVLVTSPAAKARYQKLLADDAVDLASLKIQWALGGPDRRASVWAGLQALPEEATTVVVHDAARPLLPIGPTQQAIQQVQTGGSPAAILAIPMVDTVKQCRVNSQGATLVEATLPRDTLWCAQTPQVFMKSVLLAAHKAVPSQVWVTDDAQLVELSHLGPVHIVPGEVSNLKITTPMDVELLQQVLSGTHVEQ
ncbi:MAG: 2-C-methyl-D-erythritol 4-phosphate cytidylyltransferase [Candidatus Melainabacteria bacterium]|nr:2-C-methyl-D-erythritol 4-phosphate cytidylyltransferase [Candidatus Melainabacteria bacterium]